MSTLLPLALSVAFASLALGQSRPAVFVKFSTGQVAAGATVTEATTTTIAPPGNGWNYSAAAPFAGTTWNLILRPNPGINANSAAGALGTYPFPNINNLALTAPDGSPTDVKISGSITIAALDTNTTRAEPNNFTNAADATLGPGGLMGNAWRIYLGPNTTSWRFTGLPANASYFIYFYSTNGAAFTLEAANVPAGSATKIQASGAAAHNLFTNANGTVTLTTPAVPDAAAASGQNTVWGRLHAVTDSLGQLAFATGRTALNNAQGISGVQLIPYPTATFTTPPPPTVTATVGGSVTIVGAASGEGTLTYQWLKDGVAIDPVANPTAATPSLTLSNIQESDAATYEFIVTNPGGSISSAGTDLVVTTDAVAPSITSQPGARTAVTGASISLSVTANGTAPLEFQWEKSADNIQFTALPGANSATLNLVSVTVADAGFYRLVVTNSVGTATSNSAALTVAPIIVTAPSATIVSAGGTHTISVTADVGAGAPSPTFYTWKRDGLTISDGSNISGANTAALQISDFSATQSGYYTVTVSNLAGSTTTAAVYVGVPSTQTVTFAPGNNATDLAIDQQLRLRFPSAPKLGESGSIRIHDAATDAVVLSFDRSTFVRYTLFGGTVVNAATQTLQGKAQFYLPVAIYGNEVWITLPAAQRFSYGKTYYVTMDAGFILDSSNAAVPAITSRTAWRFSIKPAGPETPTASTGPTEITVGLDGTGDFATIQGASDWIPQNNTLPRIIRVRPGVYRNTVYFAQNRNFVTLVGDGVRREEVVIYHPYPAEVYGSGARGLGTLRIDSHDVTVRNLTVDNEVYISLPNVAGAAYPAAPAFAGPIQTVATTGQRLVFNNVLIKGGQDTLYTITGSAYFYNCEVWGSVDFIYGNALGVFEQCDIVQIRSTGGPICAPDTPLAQPFGQVFLNCRFPRATMADGYPYDVGVATTTFMRPWRQDGATAVINCELGNHITTKAWSEWDGRENTCRALEYGNTLLGGGVAPTPEQRRAAGAYWLNTIDPDYTSGAISPTDPLLAPPNGPANRTVLTLNPADYTLEAIFGHPYFALAGWLPTVTQAVAPHVTAQPVSREIVAGQPVGFLVAASGSAPLAFQWRRDGTALAGATGPSFSLASAQLADAGAYDCVITNASGSTISTSATLTVLTPFTAWARGFGLDTSAPGFAAADVDADGLAHLLEFVLGGHPLQPDAGRLPSVAIVEENGAKFLVLEYTRAASAADIDVFIETTADLITWTVPTPGAGASVTVVPAGGDAEHVTVILAFPGERLYVRLRAML